MGKSPSPPDAKSLRAMLSAAKSRNMHFAAVFAGAAKGVLFVSPSAVPKPEVAKAVEASGGRTVFGRVRLAVDGEHKGKFVFRWAGAPAESLGKTLEAIIKKQCGATVKCHVASLLPQDAEENERDGRASDAASRGDSNQSGAPRSDRDSLWRESSRPVAARIKKLLGRKHARAVEWREEFRRCRKLFESGDAENAIESLRSLRRRLKEDGGSGGRIAELVRRHRVAWRVAFSDARRSLAALRTSMIQHYRSRPDAAEMTAIADAIPGTLDDYSAVTADLDELASRPTPDRVEACLAGLESSLADLATDARIAHFARNPFGVAVALPASLAEALSRCVAELRRV